MRLTEISGGLYVMISEEEQDVIDSCFRGKTNVKNTELTERQLVLADSLMHKGVLNPTINGFELVIGE